MRFWDSSAIVPLLVAEAGRRRVIGLLEDDPDMLVWWGTPVECTSAIARREREGALDPGGSTQALERLRILGDSWHEVQPAAPIRAVAARLLRTHQLRAADALQLAAAIVASAREPQTLELVSLDQRLAVAAEREGFRVVQPV